MRTNDGGIKVESSFVFTGRSKEGRKVGRKCCTREEGRKADGSGSVCFYDVCF